MRLQSFSYKNRYFLKAFLLGVAVSFLFFLPLLSMTRGISSTMGILTSNRSLFIRWPWRHTQRELFLELDYRPRRQYHRFLFLLFVGQPLFLADPSFPQWSRPLFDGPPAGPEVRVRFPHRLYLSAPLCPGTRICLDRGYVIRFFRFFRI